MVFSSLRPPVKTGLAVDLLWAAQDGATAIRLHRFQIVKHLKAVIVSGLLVSN